MLERENLDQKNLLKSGDGAEKWQKDAPLLKSSFELEPCLNLGVNGLVAFDYGILMRASKISIEWDWAEHYNISILITIK